MNSRLTTAMRMGLMASGADNYPPRIADKPNPKKSRRNRNKDKLVKGSRRKNR